MENLNKIVAELMLAKEKDGEVFEEFSTVVFVRDIGGLWRVSSVDGEDAFTIDYFKGLFFTDEALKDIFKVYHAVILETY